MLMKMIVIIITSLPFTCRVLNCIKPLILYKLKEFDSLKSLKTHLAQVFDKIID